MKYEEYIDLMKEIQNLLLSFITDDNELDEEFRDLTQKMRDFKLTENRESSYELLRMILKISKNHQRNPNFFSRIERLFNDIKTDIKSNFSDSDLFDIFKNDRHVLLFLFQNEFITVDETITKKLLQLEKKKHFICHFFYPEIKKFLTEVNSNRIKLYLLKIDENIFENFDEKRKKGVNDSYLCELIRNDSVEEFITQYNKNKFSLDDVINDSVFETNPFLIKYNKTTSIIEYAAFYGSIQIFNFLRMNNANLSPTLWDYTIHGNNPNMIHLLEENEVNEDKKNFEQYLKTALSCHHNDIANYIQDNILNEENKINLFSFQYFNYEFIPNSYNSEYLIKLIEYDYVKIIDILIQNEVIDVNYQIKCDRKDYSILRLAADYESHEIFNYLLSKPEIKIRPKEFEACRKLKQIVIPSFITTIEDEAFKNCSALIEITIPSSVTSIGKKAFSNCQLLTEITIPSSVTVIEEELFRFCDNLCKITIPSSINTIEQGAFIHCCKLTQISIPSSVTSIGNNAFSECSSLTQISIPSSVTSIGEGAFAECGLNQIQLPSSIFTIRKKTFSESSLTSITIPSSVKVIEEGAFFRCNKLTDIKIPSSVIEIQNDVFRDCEMLKNITISSSITRISNSLFYNCKSLESITIPSSVISIGYFAFSKCASLNTINLPSSLKYIGNYSFESCTSLKTIKIPKSVTIIGSNIFKGCKMLNEEEIIPTNVGIFKGGYSGLELKKEIISNEKVPRYSFKQNNSIVEIEILSTVKYICKWSFSGCSLLKTIKFSSPSSLIKIGKYAFFNCINLDNVTIPSSVVSIKESAFEECLSLKELIIENNSSLETIENFAFKGCSLLNKDTINIPKTTKYSEYCFEIYKEQKPKEDDKPNQDKKCTIF